MQDTTLVNIVKDFAEGIDVIESDPCVLQQFYDYLKLKYKIPCETGMLYVEKITMMSVFERFKIKVDHTNSLVNKKMMLYQWIKPKHLEIEEIDLQDVIDAFKRINSTEVPSVKIFYLMKSIKLLYAKIGRCLGHDDFFPYLVYCFMKSEFKDIHAHLLLMKFFKRKFDQTCAFGCSHGFQVSVSCDCLFSENWKSEDEYYITTSLAAIDYIAKIEFYNLKIEPKEFDREIAKKLGKINIKDGTDDQSTVDMG